MKIILIDFYLDWVNNFLTTEKMAAYYGITENHCKLLIETGKYYHELNTLK